MPSITSYSPFETLAFFQSVARHGSDAPALQEISTALRQNEYIRETTGFDADRLSISALRSLYEDFVQAGDGKQSIEVNGNLESSERSPKRRKLSPSPRPQDRTSQDDELLVRILVDRLYGQFKKDLLQEIRKDEEEYEKLQSEIRQLEHQADAEPKQLPHNPTPCPIVAQSESQGGRPDDQESVRNRPLPPPPPPLSAQSTAVSDSKVNAHVASSPPLTSNNGVAKSQLPSVHASLLPNQGDPTASRPNLVVASSSRSSQTTTPARQSPTPFPRQLSSPSSQRTNYGALSGQPLYSQGQAQQQLSAIQQRPPPRGQQNSGQGRGTPVPYQSQHPYPAYSQFSPQWHPHIPPQQYQQHLPYGPPPYYTQTPLPPPPPPPARHPQTPQQPPFASYSHSVPIHHVQSQQWRGQQWPVHPASATSTPMSRPDSRVGTSTPGSATPWKRKQQTNQSRQKTPPLPDRAVSPLTDKEDSPIADTKAPKKIDDQIPAQQPRRRGRPPSTTPSAIGLSRSQSIASRASDVQKDRSRQTHRIKAEPPSTPLNIPSSDTEQPQRSSGRRGRPRSNTMTSQAEGPKDTVTKRKREHVSSSPNSPIQTPQPVIAISSRHVHQSHDPSLVVVSKNFSKTSQLLLNEITSHKLAGIFAKPLSDRDAPGYKDLVLRPQDLKSIKAAISKGGRAALAAIEAVEGDDEIPPTRSQSAPLPGVGTIGNGFYLVQKTADLMPPKGIVNSAQLEMELVRMFANAVMFNPLPSSERGLSRALRLRKNGGDLHTSINSEDIHASEESESGSSSGTDEGGIIADAREMFKDIVNLVGNWRELEGERMGPSTDHNTSRKATSIFPSNNNGRLVSTSPTSNIGDEDAAAGESEATSTPVPTSTPGLGTARKRRRVAEY